MIPNVGQKMKFYQLSLITALMLLDQRVLCKLSGPSFDENYKLNWGYDHAISSSQGREVQLLLDQSSGSGFGSKKSYGSGFFHLNIKLPGKNSAGVVTAFYLTSQSTKHHDELDFEFLGNNDGKPYILQTNVIADGKGDREQRIQLWFDPTASYHIYRILWNLHQIVFFVDDYPIRVFRNRRNTGAGYPAQPLNVVTSIWNGDSWATDGGRTKINWSYAPFVAGFRSFSIYGCPCNNSNIRACYSTQLWWNRQNYWNLTPKQETDYQFVATNYMIYDYCTDKQRFPVPPPECSESQTTPKTNLSFAERKDFNFNHHHKSYLNEKGKHHKKERQDLLH